jgi:hypothetical protein
LQAASIPPEANSTSWPRPNPHSSGGLDSFRSLSALARALGTAIDRERMTLAALKTLHAPPNHSAAYANSLHDRQSGLLALERLRLAVKARDRGEFSVARGAVARASSINPWVRSQGMPYCAFLVA